MAFNDAGRSALVRHLREEALAVARVGYWPAPRGCVVYMAVNTLNGKSYVGQTVDFQRRVRTHMSDAEHGRMTPLCSAMRKYGASNFVFVPIEYCADKAAMDQTEREAIALYQTQDPEIGYNVADGGDGIGVDGANAVHARPEFRARFLASCRDRGIKAAATKRRRAAAGYYLGGPSSAVAS
jgi:predicted GIY-YIG superfamily endonuclease